MNQGASAKDTEMKKAAAVLEALLENGAEAPPLTAEENEWLFPALIRTANAKTGQRAPQRPAQRGKVLDPKMWAHTLMTQTKPTSPAKNAQSRKRPHRKRVQPQLESPKALATKKQCEEAKCNASESKQEPPQPTIPECTLEHIINFVLNLYDTDYICKPLSASEFTDLNPIFACVGLANNSRRLFHRKVLEQQTQIVASERLLACTPAFTLTADFLSALAFEAFSRSHLV